MGLYSQTLHNATLSFGVCWGITIKIFFIKINYNLVFAQRNF